MAPRSSQLHSGLNRTPAVSSKCNNSSFQPSAQLRFLPRIRSPWSQMTKVHKRELTFWLWQRENPLDFKGAQRLTQGKLTVLSCFLGQGTAQRSSCASLGKWAARTREAFETWHQRTSGHLQPAPLRLLSHHGTIR